MAFPLGRCDPGSSFGAHDSLDLDRLGCGSFGASWAALKGSARGTHTGYEFSGGYELCQFRVDRINDCSFHVSFDASNNWNGSNRHAMCMPTYNNFIVSPHNPLTCAAFNVYLPVRSENDVPEADPKVRLTLNYLTQSALQQSEGFDCTAQWSKLLEVLKAASMYAVSI